MHIELETLFTYRQYVGASISYCFDRKTYQIVAADSAEVLPEESYDRYLPLFQINEEDIQEAYILQLNRKDVLYAYRRRTVDFRTFVETHSSWEDWWQYYRTMVRNHAIEWCQKNHIRYADGVS